MEVFDKLEPYYLQDGSETVRIFDILGTYYVRYGGYLMPYYWVKYTSMPLTVRHVNDQNLEAKLEKYYAENIRTLKTK